MAKPSHPALGAVAAICYLIVRALPLRLASRLMSYISGRYPDFFLRTKSIRRNLREAFPALDGAAVDLLTRRATENFGRLIAELAHISTFCSDDRGTALKATGDLEYPFERRGPAVYVSAHLGNWELMPILFQRVGMPLHIIHTQLDQAFIDRKLMDLRRKTGATYVEKENALRSCIAALKQGEPIALLVDQRVTSGVKVQFFSQPTVFTRFPARMAMRFNCPIIVAESVRLRPGQVEVVFHPPIWPEAGDDEDVERDLTQKMAALIEACIRRNPDQWFCNKVRWKKPKPGAAVPVEQG